MALSTSVAATMKLVGGDLSIDFLNTVGGRASVEGSPVRSQVLADKLTGYADLLAWSRHAQSLGAADLRRLTRRAEARPREAAEVLARALDLRESLHRTLRSLMRGRPPEAGDLSLLNAEIGAARAREALTSARDRLTWEWREPEARLDSPLWPISRAAAALLTSDDLPRLRQCGGERCGWLFLDRSRNGRRQWCTMEDCGNVAKVRRFRQRHARVHAAGAR
jgi:predicted RNA-binding Zn ribbon-like protein